MVISQQNVSISMVAQNPADGIDGTLYLSRDGDRMGLLLEDSDGTGEKAYYDATTSTMYSYDFADGIWIKTQEEGATLETMWANMLEGFPSDWFNDLLYTEMDGYYKATRSGLSYMFGGVDISAYYDKIICDFKLENGVYTFRLIWEEQNFNWVYAISFGTASITLPDEDVPPPPADCEHGQDLANCPYCNCDRHEFADNTCTKCGLVCQHEYSDVFPNGICTKCGTECTHNYSDDTCDAVCTLCGKLQGHNYEEIVSTDRICTEGTVTTTTCRRCGYSYTETTPAKGHSYENGACTVCGEKQKVIEDTVGSMSLLPGQMYTTYSDLSGDGFYGLDPTTTPVYYNVYTYFEGYTITSIRLPIYRAEKGSVFTVRVVETSGGINIKEIARYTLTADSAISRKWVLFTDLSMKVPEGCTLVFGWMSDDIELAMPTSGYIPGYSYRNDYAGSCGTAPLIMDIYGKKTGVNQPVSGVCEHDLVTNGEAPTCTEGTTVVKACTKCLYSVTSPQPALGHDFVDGQCTRCGSADLTALSGDEIMNLIKADGCPEDKLIYGFDTEVDTATLEKIREFMLDTDAGKVFTIFSPTFYDPTEVSLYGILYESVSKTPITKEERQEYYDLVGLSEELQEIFSPHKLTTAEIEEYLMTYLGIAFTEEAKAKLLAPHYYKGEQIGSVTYMEQYDAYYMHNTDSSTNRPNELVKAYTNENGYIMVLADPSRYYDHVTAIVLAPHGDGYRFVMCVEL
jgi:hypothetical protein